MIVLQYLNIQKCIELYPLKWLILCWVNYTLKRNDKKKMLTHRGCQRRSPGSAGHFASEGREASLSGERQSGFCGHSWGARATAAWRQRNLLQLRGALPLNPTCQAWKETGCRSEAGWQTVEGNGEFWHTKEE